MAQPFAVQYNNAKEGESRDSYSAGRHLYDRPLFQKTGGCIFVIMDGQSAGHKIITHDLPEMNPGSCVSDHDIHAIEDFWQKKDHRCFFFLSFLL